MLYHILLLDELCNFDEHFFFSRRTDIPTIDKNKRTFRTRTAIGFAPNLDLRVWSHFLQLGHNRFQPDMITLFAYADIVSHEFPFFAPLVVAVIALGRIRNNESLFREVEIVDFNTVQQRLVIRKNNINLFIGRYNCIIFFWCVEIKPVVSMVTMCMCDDNAQFFPSFSGLSNSSFSTLAALRVILQFILFISYIVIAGFNNFSILKLQHLL